LSQAIRIATLGEIDQNAAKFSLNDRQVPIRVVLAKTSRQDISTIENLPVPTTTGASVPLKRIADIRFGAGPTQIQRFNQARRIFVGADLAPGRISGPVMNAIKALPIMQNLPVQTAAGGSVPLKRVAEIRFGAGPTQIQRFNQARRIFVGADLAPGNVSGDVRPNINTQPTLQHQPQGVQKQKHGDQKWQGELIQNFIIAVISGIMMVFAVLVLLYRRFVSPLVNMTSLLLAPLGGLLALLVLGQPLSIAVYIGLLMLLGIVAKNSILLIDFAIEEMEAGVPKQQAIMDAGHKRAQPILMTTVAMVAGMVPTALSISGDAAWRSSMGTTVIGGLLLSTLLTLIIVPAGFSLADGLEKRLGPWLRRKVLTYRPEDKLPEPAAYPAE
jgi:multidrug efflux pump subunit AcrB